jgi:ribosomal protein S3AE
METECDVTKLWYSVQATTSSIDDRQSGDVYAARPKVILERTIEDVNSGLTAQTGTRN